MSHHEIEACVIRAKEGNQEDLLKVLEQYKPFIYKAANQTSIRSCDTYDMLQIDCIEGSENLEEAIINSVRFEGLRSAVAELPKNEMELIIIVYFSGASLKANAEKKQITYFQAIQKKNRILEKLRSRIIF